MTIATHPYADVLPLLEGDALADFAADIKANGLREPIVLFAGTILDGRNRWNACEIAGVEPRFRDFDPDVDGDPLKFVISKNLQRRHLDAAQRAAAAANLANMRQGERTDLYRPSASVRKVSQAEAAKLCGASERSVTLAAMVKNKGSPKLFHALEQGRLAVTLAAKLATAPEAIQLRAVAEPERAHVLMKQERRHERERETAGKILALPSKRYGVILADPEWRFEPWSRETGMDRAADNHYPTSELTDIAARDLASIAADDCVLFIWATAPMLPQALDVMSSWGFDYKSNFVWAKDRIGTGYWNRNQHELLLIGTRGDVLAPAMGTQFPSLIEAPVGSHSEKPPRFHEIIETHFPNVPKIELNARRRRHGWDAWGFEAPT